MPENPGDHPYYAMLEVENRDCIILSYLKSKGINNARIIDVSKTKKGVEHAVCFSGKGREEECRILVSKGCPVCRTLYAHAHIVTGFSQADKTTFTVMVKDKKTLSKVVDSLRSSGYVVSVRRIFRSRSAGRVVTPRQRAAILLALLSGYFDYPRRASTKELAKQMGVSESTFNELLRRGVKRILEHFFISEKTRID